MPRRCIPILLLLLAHPAAAQDPPVPQPMCIPQREGMVHCFVNTLCRCAYEPGGTLVGRPPGYRWDCGPLRPSCAVVPPDTSPLGPGAGQPSILMQPLIQPVPREGR